MISLLASVAVACMCPQPSLDEAAARATIVFVGKTREDAPGRLHLEMAQYRTLQPLLGPQEAEFEVGELLNGKLVGSRVSITMGPIHQACMQFKAGVD